MLFYKSELLVEVWDGDGKKGDDDDKDDLMEKLTISAVDTAIDFGQSYTVPGELGITNFTLLYHNLTTEQNACIVVDNLTCSTYKPTPQGK